MATQQLLVRLPDELVRRLKRQVRPRQRSAFVQRLLESALMPEVDDDDPLYCAALLAEQDEKLTTEMADWDVTVGDGIDEDSADQPVR